jgi:hypothetical protein
VDDTPFINDGADTSLRKTVSLLNKIEAKTGSTTITGPVTVSNEVEVTNSSGSPIPVSGTVTANTGLTQPLTDTQLRAASVPISQATAANLNATVVGSGSFTAAQATASNLKAQAQLLNSSGTVADYATTGSAGTPSADVLSVQGVSGGTALLISSTNLSNIDTDLGAPSDSAASSDTGTFSVIALIKRGLQNWTSLLAKIPALVSGRIPVDGSGVTQPISASSLPLPSGASTAAKQPALGTAGTPSSDVITVQGASAGTALNTKETQPTDDYVINTSAFSNFSAVGSLLTSAAFDAGASADYVVITLEGGGSSGAFYYDLSILNTGLWDPGNGVSFSTYYDIPASSATDAYSYRSVAGTSFFGGTRTAFNGRFIVPLTQNTPYAGTSTTYRYIRLNCPGSYGGWRYRFTSYKSVNPLLGASVPGNASTTRVNGRVDVGYVANLPTLSATVTQSTATSLRAQAEAYQGGTAVGSANPLQVTLANTGANATAVKVDGSAVTQPVSLASAVTTTPQQGTTVASTTFTSTTASSSVIAASATRKGLTVYNAGFGDLYICAGATCTTTSFQLKLVSGDYWECPPAQVTLAHAGVYATAGTAYVTTIT